MARISTYVIDGSIVDGDKVIGSDANNSMITKNYTVGDLAAYIGYSIGNNLLVPYVNASQNVDLGAFNLTANSVIIDNQLILSGTAGLPGQVIISNGSGSPASWGYNIGTQTLRDVLNQGNTGNKNLILSNTTTSTIALDLEKLYGANVGMYVFDNLLNSSSALFPNKLDVQESSLQKTASYSASGIRYSSNGNNVDVNPNSYANQTLLYPSSSGVLVTSVNGNSADLTGNVTLSGLGVGTVTSVAVTPGTGISASVANPTTTPNITITNTAPDQVVNLSPTGTGLSITGTYPSFTLQNTLPDQTVVLSSGTGISITGTYPNFTITNTGSSITPAALTKVDDTNVILTLGGSPSTALLAATSITLGWTGTLADSRIASATTWNGKQDAITLTTIGTSGVATFIANTLNIPDYGAGYTIPTLQQVTDAGATTTNVITAPSLNLISGANSINLANSNGNFIVTNTGTSDELLNVTNGVNGFLRFGGGSGQYVVIGINSSANVSLQVPSTSGIIPTSVNGNFADAAGNITISTGSGTVTSVAALTLGTSGTNLSSTVADSTTTPVITLNVPNASATNRGALLAADWTTFNNKQNALTNPVTGTGINNEIAYFNTTGSTIASLPTATYPSLTELSYVKGVTSAIQTQIGTKITDNSWVDYSATSTFVGWTSFTTKKLQYKVLGANTLLVQFQIEGVSNAATASFTLPNNASSWGVQYFMAQSTNTSSVVPSIGFMNASSNVVSVCVNAILTTVNTWSTTGAKNIRGQLIVNI